MILFEDKWIMFNRRCQILTYKELASQLNMSKDKRFVKYLKEKEQAARKDFNRTIDWWCVWVAEENKKDSETVDWRLKHISHPSRYIKRTEPMQRRYGMRYLEMWEFHAICSIWGIQSADQVINRYGLKGDDKLYVLVKEQKALIDFNERYCPVRDPNQIISREEMNDVVPTVTQFQALPDSKGQRVVEKRERKNWRKKNPCNVS